MELVFKEIRKWNKKAMIRGLLLFLSLYFKGKITLILGFFTLKKFYYQFVV